MASDTLDMALDMEFDLDNLYKDTPKNSDNPIATDEPEVLEDTGCVGGACTL